jgi:hypothetical protein
VKPWPAIAAEFTVTAAVPVDLRVSDCALDPFTATFPNARLVELTVIVGVPVVGLSCSAKVFDIPPRLAVSVTACAEVTAEAVARKVELVELVAIAAEAGTVTLLLLLERLTLIPPEGAGPLSVGVQVKLLAPVRDETLQEKALSVGAGFNWIE